MALASLLSRVIQAQSPFFHAGQFTFEEGGVESVGELSWPVRGSTIREPLDCPKLHAVGHPQVWEGEAGDAEN